MTNLPTLTGTEKQVAWAERIRAEMMDKVAQQREAFVKMGRVQKVSDEKMAEELAKFDAATEPLKAKTDAAWWIDRRSHTAFQAMKDAAR